jgi:hypothetical protein
MTALNAWVVALAVLIAADRNGGLFPKTVWTDKQDRVST